MSAKSTPGPWRVVVGVCKNDHPETSADVIGAEDEPVANCWCHERSRANAKLIAAAPALADALIGAIEFYDGDAPEFDVDAARAALRAAGRLP